MRLLILLTAAALFFTATHHLLAAGADKILARRNQLESEFHDRCLEIIGQTNFVGNADLYRNRLAEAAFSTIVDFSLE